MNFLTFFERFAFHVCIHLLLKEADILFENQFLSTVFRIAELVLWIIFAPDCLGFLFNILVWIRGIPRR